MKISLERIFYPLKTLGPGNRVGIWSTGCPRQCPGCISPELQRYDVNREVSVEYIMSMINTIPGSIDGFTISGGEPFLKPSVLNQLVHELAVINDDILIFTGYTYAELVEKNDPNIREILEICSVLIDGPYVQNLHCDNGLRGSSNQNIWVFKHKEKYEDIEDCKRNLQAIVRDGNIITLGIP